MEALAVAQTYESLSELIRVVSPACFLSHSLAGMPFVVNVILIIGYVAKKKKGISCIVTMMLLQRI